MLQHFSFVAAKPGKYAVISAVPDGQADSEMWDYVPDSSPDYKPADPSLKVLMPLLDGYPHQDVGGEVHPVGRVAQMAVNLAHLD